MLSKRLKDLYNDQGELFAPMLEDIGAEYTELGDYLDRYLYKKYRNILLVNDFTVQDIYNWLVGVNYNFNCLYKALVQQYEPLSNYDMSEASVDGRSVAQSTTNTQQNGKIISNQSIPSKQLNHYTTTFDNSSTGRLESYDTEEPMRNANPEYNHYAVTQSVTYQEEEGGKKGLESTSKFDGVVTGEAGELEASANEVNTHELTRKGNIGVTTSQQMLQSEIDLRISANFFNMFGERFVADCTTGMYASSYGVREEYIPWL